MRKNTEITTRPWRIGDLETIRAIALQSWRDAYGDFLSAADIELCHRQHYSLWQLRERFPRQYGRLGLADETIVAYALAEIHPDKNHFHVLSLHVLAQYRGLGLGGRLLEEQAITAGQLGFDRIWLDVMVNNHLAHDWYRRRGFIFTEAGQFKFGNSSQDLLVGYKMIDSLQQE
ncbi:MAG: GNAT family N-acetyltransferase [Candidatus Neomarinimicrobiota bacterium]